MFIYPLVMLNTYHIYIYIYLFYIDRRDVKRYAIIPFPQSEGRRMPIVYLDSFLQSLFMLDGLLEQKRQTLLPISSMAIAAGKQT